MKWPFWTRSGHSSGQTDDCETIDPLLSLYADGMASAEEAKRVEAHLPACADCRESLEWMQATQRVLSARPIISPPPDLRARIAEAIAASTDAPLQPAFTLRPSRVFALRPILAAAASLSILGLVGYGLLHTPHPNNHLPTTSHTTVAILPPTTSPTVTSKPQIKPRHHPVTQPAPLDMTKVATNEPDTISETPTTEVKTTAEPKKALRTTPTFAPTLVHLPSVKKTASPKSHLSLMAKIPPIVPTVSVKTPVVTPEVKKPDVVAAVPNPAPPVPVTVAPTIIHQDTTAMVASSQRESHLQNADLLKAVNAHVRETQQLFHSTGGNAIKGAILVSHTMDTDRTAYVPGVYTP